MTVGVWRLDDVKDEPNSTLPRHFTRYSVQAKHKPFKRTILCRVIQCFTRRYSVNVTILDFYLIIQEVYATTSWTVTLSFSWKVRPAWVDFLFTPPYLESDRVGGDEIFVPVLGYLTLRVPRYSETGTVSSTWLVSLNRPTLVESGCTLSLGKRQPRDLPKNLYCTLNTLLDLIKTFNMPTRNHRGTLETTYRRKTTKVLSPKRVVAINHSRKVSVRRSTTSTTRLYLSHQRVYLEWKIHPSLTYLLTYLHFTYVFSTHDQEKGSHHPISSRRMTEKQHGMYRCLGL